jgi:hypothetical protein
MREMRKSGRVFTRCQVVTKVLRPKDAALRYGSPRYGHTSDFSLDGMRLVLGADLPLGATVELVVVMLNPPATFQHFGQVRWCKCSTDGQKCFVGIEFNATSPAVMQAWRKLLAERFPATVAKMTNEFAKDDHSLW